MASNLRANVSIDIGGQPLPFGSPFVSTFLETEQEPARYEVSVGPDGTDTLWDGAPPFTTFDFVAFVADRDCHIGFVVNGGEADEYSFSLPLPANMPMVIPGGQAYAGGASDDPFSGGTLREITKITVLNTDTDNAVLVKVCIAQQEEV